MRRAEAAAIARAAKMAKQPSLNERFWSKVSILGPNECWPWRAAFRSNSGPQQAYGAFWMNGRHQSAPRVALELSGVVPPGGMDVCHRCDNPPCCNPAHLFIGTPQANVDDKVAKGRQVKGERVHTAKLTVEQVAEIRMHRPPGVKKLKSGVAKMLATQFGVTASYVSEILSQKSWRPD